MDKGRARSIGSNKSEGDVEQGQSIVQILTHQIAPDPANLRQAFDEADIQSLAENLLEVGQMDPIQVFRRPDGTYDLFDGERRWRAAKRAGLATMKALVIERPSEADLLVKKVSRAMQTRALAFPEQIRALEEGLHALGAYHEPAAWPDAARKLGIPVGLLRERMRITRLSDKLRTAFDAGSLDYTIAQTLGRIQDPKRQEEAARFIRENNLSNRFVSTKFIEAVLEEPDRPLLQAYDIAREREKFRYVPPRREEIPGDTVDRLDDLLAALRRAEQWLETAAREDLIASLSESRFNSSRFWSQVRRLYGILDAFIRRDRASPVDALPSPGSEVQISGGHEQD